MGVLNRSAESLPAAGRTCGNGVAKEEGYAYLYVSNENPTLVDAYFDDVVMTHTKSNIIQYNEYYPYGLQTTNSWTRESSTGNDYLYNGGNELNKTTGNYEMFFRGYDPALGRMLQVDPMASKYAGLTPYNYAFNDPVFWNDLLGADPIVNPGFNPAVWQMLESAWNSVWEPSMDGGVSGGGGSSGSWSSGGAFQYENGVLVSDLTYGQYETENGVYKFYSYTVNNSNPYWVPQNFDQAQGMVMASAITAIEMSNGWSQTEFQNRDQAVAAVSTQVGFDIKQFTDAMLLQEVVVRDTPLEGDSPNPLTLISLVYDYGIAITDAQLLLNNLSNAASSSKALALLKKLNPAGGFLDIASHGSEARKAYQNGDYTSSVLAVGKIGVDVFFLATKTNPWFLAGQAAWSLYNSYEDAKDYGLFNNK